MKIRWKDFEIEINSAKDLELLREFISTFESKVAEEIPKEKEIKERRRGQVVWTEEKILEYIQQGWSLSWDRTNQKFKLLKREGGVVKSYTLPRDFNSFCEKLLKEKKTKDSIKEAIERQLERYLAKHSKDHPELAEFAKYLEEKGFSVTTIYHAVSIAHKYAIHKADTKYLQPASRYSAKERLYLWYEFLVEKGKYKQAKDGYIELIKENWGYNWFKLDYFTLTTKLKKDKAKEFLDHLAKEGILESKYEGGDYYYRLVEEKKGLEKLFNDEDKEEEFDLKKSLFESRKVIEGTLR